MPKIPILSHFLLTNHESRSINNLYLLLLNKTELVAAIAEKAGLSKKDAEGAVKAFTDTVAEQLKAGEKIQLVGFGTFEVAERAARTGKNPQTGEAIKIPASKAPKFKAGKALKDVVNTPAAPAKKSKKK